MAGLYHKRRVAALVSGGVESTYLLECLAGAGNTVHPLYVRQGFRWEMAELWWLRRLVRHWPRSHVRPVTVLSAPAQHVPSHHWSRGTGYVPGDRSADRAMHLPGRNLSLFTAAGLWCSSHQTHRVAHGTLKSNPFPDATPVFFSAMSRLLSRALHWDIRCEAPLRRWTKAHVVRQLPVPLLRASFSCVSPHGRRPCQLCNKCAERHKALHQARISL
jgi:7-cyano-7-deazaguanine synthase